ncbi:hypothetical protein [Methylosinus sp. LW3]|uniref:hypothetical protein n=1 Tax=Methylosinus sp. LW3 TaxID=107635 RepID=UPI0012F9A51B|nr:hypothetical protein [Methylosinus sp. LW3]
MRNLVPFKSNAYFRPMLIFVLFVLFELHPALAAPTPRCVWVLGDSLAAGLASELALGLPDYQVLNGGFGGQSSRDIAARAGVAPIRVVVGERRSNEVILSKVFPPTLPFAGADSELIGHLGDVAGRLRWSRKDGFSFAPQRSAEFEFLTGEMTFSVDLSAVESCILILWAGRNDVRDPQPARLHLAAILAAAKKRGVPALSLGVINSEDEDAASGQLRNILNINEFLADQSPSAYFDVRSWLLTNALRTATVEPTKEDMSDVAKGVPPRSLRSDHIHLNSAGNRALAKQVALLLRERKW